MPHSETSPTKIKSLGNLFFWLRVFFIAYIIGEFATIFGSIYILNFGGYILGPEYNFNLGETVLSFNALFFLFAFLGSIITFCLFSYRSVKNIKAWDDQVIDISPGWSVGWYFVPFANLWKPYGAMTDIWYGSHQSTDKNWDTPFYMPIWWLCWIIMNIISNISYRLSMRAGYMDTHVSDIPLYKTTLVMDTISSVLGIIAAYLILKILRKITDKQDARINMEIFS